MLIGSYQKEKKKNVENETGRWLVFSPCFGLNQGDVEEAIFFLSF